MLSAGLTLALALVAQGDLDRCLGDRPAPLDAKLVAGTWRALAVGQKAPALAPLRALGAGVCVTSWWSPVEPEHACGPEGRRWRLIPMGDAGTVVIDASAAAWTWRDARDELRQVGDALVVLPRADNQRVDGGRVKLVTAKGEVLLPGYPDAIAGDRAVVQVLDRTSGARNDVLTRVVDTRTMKTLFPLAPRKGDEHNIVASVITPTAVAGFRNIHGAGAEAFAVDARTGALLAAVTDAWPTRVGYGQRTPDGGIVLAAWHENELEVVHVLPRVGDGAPRVVRRTVDVRDIDAEREHPGVVIVAGAGSTVAVGLGRHLVLVDDDAARAPVRIATGTGPMPGVMVSLAGLYVHEGGRIVSYPDSEGRRETVVIEAKNGRVITRGDAIAFVAHPTHGAVLALSDIKAPRVEEQIVLVKADGTLVRGALGTARVGHFDVRTLAGAEDPLACDARALSILPRLVKHPGPPESGVKYALPADVVR